MEEDHKFNLTVGQLIELLQVLPQDLPILTNGFKSGFENIYNPEVVELKHEPENFYHHGEFQVANKNDKNTFQGVILQRFLRDDWWFSPIVLMKYRQSRQLSLHSSKQTVAQINQCIHWRPKPDLQSFS